jgi:hypothetical protein
MIMFLRIRVQQSNVNNISGNGMHRVARLLNTAGCIPTFVLNKDQNQ